MYLYETEWQHTCDITNGFLYTCTAVVKVFNQIAHSEVNKSLKHVDLLGSIYASHLYMKTRRASLSKFNTLIKIARTTWKGIG